VPTPALSRILAASVAAAALAALSLVPVSAANAVTGGRIVITEWMYKSAASSGDGEFAEFTNTGDAPVDLTGWTFDNSTRNVAALSLTSLGTIQAGESFLVTDEDPAAFRSNWGLPDSIKVLENGVDHLGNGDEINIWDSTGALQDRLTYPNDKKTSGTSAWVAQADLGAGQGATNAAGVATANATDATKSVVGDASGTWTGADGSVGSPGLSQFGSNFRFARINEVTSAGADTVELANVSTLPIDITGWEYVDGDPSHTPTVIPNPSATTIPAHGYVTFDSTAFGLGSGDSVHLLLPDGTTAVDDVTWTGAVTDDARCPDGLGAFTTLTTQSFGASNTTACASSGGSGSGGTDAGNPPSTDWQDVKINEVDSDTDTVELVNTGANPVDVSAWKATDSDPSHTATTITPSAATVPAGGFVTFHSPFGLGAGGDAVDLFLADGTTAVDSVTWTADEAEPGSYARCPADGTGAFLHVTASSFGSSNATACQTPYLATPSGGTVPCDTEAPTGTGPAIAGGTAWPGSQDAHVSDTRCAFVTTRSGQDVSGLVFDPSDPDVLWAAKNKSHVYKLVKQNGLWVPDTTDDWGAGKETVFADGTGQPDSEAITVGGDGAIYMTTERDNADKNVPRDTVLRFDQDSNPTGATLTPTAEWDFTAAELGLDPATDANLGFEGITYVPDSALVADGFVDQSTHAAYDPAGYAGHGSGLYFLAVEKTAHILAYALSTGGAVHRVADIATGMPAIAETQWDADSNALWAIADNTSSGSTELLRVDASGAFAVDKVYDRPTGLPDDNLEGFAIAPSSTCVNGQKEVVRSDDGNNGGHSLWSGTIDCDLGLDAAVSISASSVAAGSNLTVDATGLTPGQSYVVILHSTPVTLGSATAGVSGALRLAVAIPAGTAVGPHSVSIANANDPATLFASAALTVTAATAASALALTGLVTAPPLVAASVLLLLGAGLAVGSRLRRRRARG